MATRVVLHVGTPKTGTTYLQTVMWRNRDTLRAHGVLLPGLRKADHLWSSMVVCGNAMVARRDPTAASSWDRLVDEVKAWPGTAVISHEFFGAATAQQAAAAMQRLGAADVHVVVTAREWVGMLTARWQEHAKHRHVGPLSEYVAAHADSSLRARDGLTMDAADVSRRWGTSLDPDHVHVITLPRPGSPADLLWRRFCEVLAVEPTAFDSHAGSPNESLGVVEVELLRRVTPHLPDTLRTPREMGRWVRGYLAQGLLVPRGGERFAPAPDQVQRMRCKSDEIVSALEVRGYTVHGDLEDLRTPEELPTRPHPDDVTAAQMLDAATETIARLVTDVRRARLKIQTQQSELRKQKALVRKLQRKRTRQPTRSAPGTGAHRRSVVRRAASRVRRLAGAITRRVRP